MRFGILGLMACSFALALPAHAKSPNRYVDKAAQYLNGDESHLKPVKKQHPRNNAQPRKSRKDRLNKSDNVNEDRTAQTQPKKRKTARNKPRRAGPKDNSSAGVND